MQGLFEVQRLESISVIVNNRLCNESWVRTRTSTSPPPTRSWTPSSSCSPPSTSRPATCRGGSSTTRTDYAVSDNRMLLQGVPSGRRLGLVDLEFDYSTVCPTLLQVVGVWQKGLGTRSKWWSTLIIVNQTQVYDQMGHSVVIATKPCMSLG